MSIFLPQPPNHWNYRHGHLVSVQFQQRCTMGGTLGVEFRPSLLSRGAAGWGSWVEPHLTSLSLCGPQPETEDEKRRFEEGKGRYLQMKAKRQGQAEPQP